VVGFLTLVEEKIQIIKRKGDFIDWTVRHLSQGTLSGWTVPGNMKFRTRNLTTSLSISKGEQQNGLIL
jgi:hypothetical protein